MVPPVLLEVGVRQLDHQRLFEREVLRRLRLEQAQRIPHHPGAEFVIGSDQKLTQAAIKNGDSAVHFIDAKTIRLAPFEDRNS